MTGSDPVSFSLGNLLIRRLQDEAVERLTRAADDDLRIDVEGAVTSPWSPGPANQQAVREIVERLLAPSQLNLLSDPPDPLRYDEDEVDRLSGELREALRPSRVPRAPRQVPLKRKRQTLVRDNFTCQCGRRPPEAVMHVDHIVPLSLGGGNNLENLQTLCDECNLGKGADMEHP